MDHGVTATIIAALIAGAGLEAPGPAALPGAPGVAPPTAAPDPAPAPGPIGRTAGPTEPAAGVPAGDPDGEEAESARPAPRLFTDIAVVGGLTAFHSLAYPDVRRPLLSEGSFGNVLRNFASPIRRAREGWAEDDGSFATNFVAHPLSWGMMGLYLKERGYSNASALLFTQVHSIAWEYVVEGLYQKPSGLDMVTNLTSASTAIFVLHAVAERAARREEKGVHHRVLTALNPLRPFRGLFRPASDGSVRVTAAPAPGGVGLSVAVRP